MKQYITVSLLAALLIFIGMNAEPAFAHGNTTYVVKPGDTLSSVARRHDVSVAELANTNGLSPSAWVYAGQELVVPGAETTTTSDGTHVVQATDTLWSIARRTGTSVAAIRSANGLGAGDFIYTGQRLTVPDGSSVAESASADGEKWIEVDLTTQTLVAYEGQTPVLQTKVSTGRAEYPTVVGTFRTYLKYPKQRMTGGSGEDYYDLPNVPDVMYFYQGYALHGTYWHTNFGTPMSHGCVNLPLEEADWLYDWAPLGTKVVTHY